MKEPNHIFFSTRTKIAELAEAWCAANNAPLNSLNIVTALNAIGALKSPNVFDPDELRTMAAKIKKE